MLPVLAGLRCPRRTWQGVSRAGHGIVVAAESGDEPDIIH